MEYISAEEFKKQPKEVQKVFLDWYKNQKGWETDLFDYIGDCEAYKTNFPTVGKNIDFRVLKHGEETLILFTEGGLRKFIEDKTSSIIEIRFDLMIDEYYFYLNSIEENIEDFGRIEEELGNNLLQAYWKVALEIAKEKVTA